jgi:tight adherence protein C
MSQLTIPLIALFASLALLAGMATSAVLARQAPGRGRLVGLAGSASRTGVLVADDRRLSDAPTDREKRLAAFVPKSPKEMGRLQRRLAMAGLYGFKPALIYSLAEMIGAAAGFILFFFVFGLRTGWLFGIGGAVVGYMIPGYIVARRIRMRKKEIQNGLPDALDLLIVSLEAGLSMDQAILKCAEELAIAYPALSSELQLVNTETRAGKPRVEALKNFARRTMVDDVRALVAMLVQTERFGTSVAQALRTHAEESRVKRRQRAEERAAKLSVKLIFPLVFCLLPAFFVVAVGPGVIKFVEVFTNMNLGGGINP